MFSLGDDDDAVPATSQRKPLDLDESSLVSNDRLLQEPSPSTGINLQQYSQNLMFTHHDAMNAGTAIDPSPLIGQGTHPHAGEDSAETIDNADAAAGPTGNNGNGNGNDAANNGLSSDDPPSSKWKERALHPYRSTKTYFHDLSSFFTWRFLSWLAIDNFAIAGGVFTLLLSSGLPLFKELGIGASRQQLYMTMMMSPWAMKPFIGVASDLFPIRGYNKRYFALYSILIGLAGCATLLGLYHSGTAEQAVSNGSAAVQHLADWIVVCFTMVSYEGATLDILGEGKYSEIMRIYPESGSSVISFKFGCSLAGSILTQMYVGPLADAGHFHILFWIALVLSLMPFFPTLMGWIPEKKRSIEEPGMKKLCPGCLFDNESFQKKKVPFIVITLSGLAGPLLAAVTTYADLEIGLLFSLLALIALVIVTYVVFPRVMFYVVLSLILQYVSSPTLGSALGYYYTADEKCVPDGPHFDYTYYITVTGIVGSLVNFVAVVLYQALMSTWRFRPALIFTIVIGALAPIVDLIIVMRWNVAIGISDKLFFLLGNAIFENLVVILQNIPMSAIFAKIAPPGMESAVFAYTVGIANFCGMLSGLLGSGIIKWSNMKTVGEDCDFDNLGDIIVLFKILLPMVVGIPATFLIPNVLQTEPLIDWDKERWCEDDNEEDQGNLNTHENENIDESLDSRIEPHLL